MIPSLSLTRLRKVASDNGFDLEHAPVSAWLAFASTQAPLRIWLTVDDNQSPTVALSKTNVAHNLSEFGVRSELPPPDGALAAIETTGIEQLHLLLRRAFQLSRALPNEPLRRFEQAVASLPKSTEAERLVVLRIGQGIYRQGLIEYWKGRCAITGLETVEILRASHSKPWSDCTHDAERLDVFNGFLLAPHLDALFDRGFMTIDDAGVVIFSAALSQVDRDTLGLKMLMRTSELTDSHRAYLAWHRQRIFRRNE
jgi:putative restriction endonuclease